MEQTATQELEEILNASSATAEFKAAVEALQAGDRSPLIEFGPGNPPVKVLRFLMKLLEEFPEREFESITVDGQSGCSDYTGTATAEPGAMNIEFVWDCAWRAQQEGWKDMFGDPDQIRAAQTYGYQCFKKLKLSGA